MEPLVLGYIYLEPGLEYVQPGIEEEYAVVQTLKTHFFLIGI